MKRKVLIYGAGQNFINNYSIISSRFIIVGLIDGDKNKEGNQINGYVVQKPDVMLERRDYDLIIVTPTQNSDILMKLRDNNVSEEKIITIKEIYDESYRQKQLRIAIAFYGGMGDFLIGKNWMYHLINEFNLINDTWEVFIDKVAYNRGKDIFEISTYVDSVNCGYELLDNTNQYDVIIHFCIVPYIQYFAGEIVYYNNIEFGKYILRLMDFGFESYCMGFCRNPKFYSTIRKLMEKFPERKYHNLCDLFGNLGIQDEYSFSLSIEKDENEYLSSLGLLNNSFITINTGLNRDYNAVSSTRAWSIANWDRLAQLLKAKRSDIQIVQVGEKMQDDCVIKADINLNGKTSIDEARILMKNALIHVDYDGGLVHVRHILNGGPSVILFGPTNVFRHSYKENIGIRTSDCPEDCEWLTDKWLFECPKGYDKAICMESINPEYVCERIIDILDNIN